MTGFQKILIRLAKGAIIRLLRSDKVHDEIVARANSVIDIHSMNERQEMIFLDRLHEITTEAVIAILEEM